MNLKARVYIESQKKEAQARLAARLEALKGKGLDAEAMQRDAALRKIKAEIRHSDFRLASIAAQVKQNQDLAQAKINRLAAEQTARETPQEAEPAPGKKEKKAKKAKPEGGEAAAKPKKEKKQPKEPREEEKAKA